MANPEEAHNFNLGPLLDTEQDAEVLSLPVVPEQRHRVYLPDEKEAAIELSISEAQWQSLDYTEKILLVVSAKDEDGFPPKFLPGTILGEQVNARDKREEFMQSMRKLTDPKNPRITPKKNEGGGMALALNLTERGKEEVAELLVRLAGE